MNLKFRLIDIGVTLLIFLSLLVGSMTAINYFENDGIFEAEISYINNIKTPYSLILNLENLVDEELDFDIEIVYLKENLVVSQDSLYCENFCEVKLDFNRVFFDDYKVFIRTEHEGNYYEKELDFTLEKEESLNSIFMNNIFFYSELSSINISGILNLETPSDVIIEVNPADLEDRKEVFEFECLDMECPFDLDLSKEIIFGNYELRVYLPNDVLKRNFRISNELGERVNLDVNFSINTTLRLNSNVDKVQVMDLFGNIKTVDVKDGEIDGNGIISVEENIQEGKRLKRNVKPKIKSIDSLEDIEKITENKNVAGFSTNSQLDNNSKNSDDLFERKIIVSNDLNINSSFLNGSGFDEIVYEDEKIYLRQGSTLIDIEDVKNFSNNRLVPGIYKQEKVVRFADGREEITQNYFAYGLISINTLKPLYLKDEVSEMLLVVLDRWGYLVDDANISLYITKPSGEQILLSSENGDISLTENSGVYSTALLSDELGEYELFAQVDVDGFNVEIDSFYNVVENYEFDIIRDVPATIDPWQGPFRNDFEIKPRNNYVGEYDFTEVFSSEFEIIETDADIIEEKNDSFYLTWTNLNGVSDAYYIAQTPLKTPYLYYLGKSYVDYSEGFLRFYENRSWLFAIDPAARTCGIDSPCICGAACSGGNEPGDGTIDACTDGNSDYEWTNDIRVTSQDGPYFGVGDTVEICVDYQCDVGYGGDRALIGYKDGSGGWVDADVIFQTGTTGQATACVGSQTYCVTQTLNNYVGVHHIRGSTVYQGNANRICEQPFYRDHDDVEFEVLDKVAPNLINWNLNNGTNSGNNLNVIRGKSISSNATWDLPLQSGSIRYNSGAGYNTYLVDSYENNKTSYLFNTSNVGIFSQIGQVNIDLLQANDFYFDITGSSSGQRDFFIYGEVQINQSTLEPNVGYEGLNTEMSCQVTDDNLEGISYPGVSVDFYQNGSLLGSNVTNSTGWSVYNFQENNVGDYDIECRVENQGFYLETLSSIDNRELFVRENNTDINIPLIDNVSISSNLFSSGGVTTISADVTDNVLIDNVKLFVTLPNSTILSYPMNFISGNNYSYTFSKTTLDGNYRYYIRAEDNSANPAFSSTRNFEVTGIRAFIGIQSQDDVFKLGDALNLNLFSKVNDVSPTLYQEEGDVNFFYYSFDTSFDGWTTGGTRDDWARGVPSGGFTNRCDQGSCLATNLPGNYRSNSNQWAQSPLINLSGRSNLKINYWRMLQVEDGLGTDRAFFEGSDDGGGSWNTYFQDSLIVTQPTYNLNAGFTTLFPTELEGSENARFRFRLTSDGGTQYNGWAFDSVNVSFNPRVDWNKNWNIIDSNFGVDVDKLTAIKIGLNITYYDSTGSNLEGSNSPDIEVQIFNGTEYSNSFFCNLDDTITYPYNCEVIIKNLPEYLDPWSNQGLRNVRFRAINMDNQDSIEWKDVTREYITPSIVENNGEGEMTAYLLQQFRNSTGDVIETLYFDPLSLQPDESRQLSDFWTYNIAGDFQLGNYFAYVALTDADKNVLVNDDDGSLIEDSYEFEINSLIIQVLNPLRNSIKEENFLANISLDTSSFGFGGWCGYSLNNQNNVTMNNPSLNYLESNLNNLRDGSNDIIFYCNDSDGDVVNSGVVNFNVSQEPQISFVAPTLSTGSVVDTPWYEINSSISDAGLNELKLEFGETNYTLLDDSLILNFGANNLASLGESSTFAYDSSIFDNHGSFEGNSGFSTFGRNGGSFQFDGVDDWVEIEDNESLDSMNKFSFEAWIYDSSTDTQPRGIASKRVDQNSPDYSWSIFRWNSREVYFDVGNTGDRHSATGFTLPSNQWVHLVVTFDGSAPPSERKKFYVDGELISTQPSTETLIPRSVGVPTTIGILNPGYGNSWDGYIDEVKIYEKVLNEEEVILKYNTNVVQTSFDDWYGYVNLTNIKNDIYQYRACALDVVDNINCTEYRNIQIDKELPIIFIDSPENGMKYSSSDNVWANSTTSLPVVWSAVEVRNNGTILEQNEISSTSWSFNLNSFNNGEYNVTFYANDSIGNQVINSSIFYVFADKHVRISKILGKPGNLSAQHNIVVENFGRWENYTIYDVVKTPWSIFNNIDLFDNQSFSEGFLLRKNISINTSNSQLYLLNTSIDMGEVYSSNWRIGID